MSSPNHKLRQSNEQTFRMLHVRRIAVIVLEDLEATCVRYIEKLEVGIELCERVEYWGPTESPLIRVGLADILETVEKEKEILLDVRPSKPGKRWKSCSYGS
jgi:hypothetical protein